MSNREKIKHLIVTKCIGDVSPAYNYWEDREFMSGIAKCKTNWEKTLFEENWLIEERKIRAELIMQLIEPKAEFNSGGGIIIVRSLGDKRTVDEINDLFFGQMKGAQ